MEKQVRDLKENFYRLAGLGPELRTRALREFASLIETEAAFLLNENKKDLDEQSGKISSALFNRLKLTEAKLRDLVAGLKQLAESPDQVGELLEKRELAEALILEKRRCPIGLVAVVFESRPDVIPQILGLILRSGNVVALKGGKEAHHSNKAFMNLVERLESKLPELGVWAELLDSREDFHKLLQFDSYVDLVIPRGSNQLVQAVMANTKIPVLGHADGVCHIFVDASAQSEMAVSIVLDAKAQYPAACNSMETLILDKALAPEVTAELFESLSSAGVELRLSEELHKRYPQHKQASPEDWSTEYGDLVLSVLECGSMDEVVDHIHRYGSAHTDAILAQDEMRAREFLDRVDSSSVMWNSSTRFADGFRYGLGAELGISTHRLHARGPVGIEGLSLYRYQVFGAGQCVAEFEKEGGKKFTFKDLKA